MKSGTTCRARATLGAECYLSWTAMLRFIAGKTPSLCSQSEAPTEVDLQAHFSPPGARIFTLSGNGPRRTSWNPDGGTQGRPMIRRFASPRERLNGFTLIELLVV